VDGRESDVLVPGYTLLHQFRVDDGYLLVTDHDCPFEEATTFTLLDPALRILSVCQVGKMYSSFLLTRLEWLDARRLTAWFGDDFRVRITLRPWGIPLIRPRLGIRRVRDDAAAARG
jgi:hypothetical protein